MWIRNIKIHFEFIKANSVIIILLVIIDFNYNLINKLNKEIPYENTYGTLEFSTLVSFTFSSGLLFQFSNYVKIQTY